MEGDKERNSGRARAKSETVPSRQEGRLSPAPPNVGESSQPMSADAKDSNEQEEFGKPTRASTVAAKDFRPPRRSETTSLQRETSAGLRRRDTAASRRSGGEGHNSTIAGRSRGLTLAGVQDAPVIQQAYEPYVHPEYTALNPAYEQPANIKPVWSLAKPLPRVVRPGMIPTKSEIFDARQNAELPGEQTQKAGLDVDPNDLEAGRIDLKLNPKKVSAQLMDSRAQRENNLITSMARRGTVTSRIETRPTRASSTASRLGRGRASSTASQKPVTDNAQATEDGGKAQEAPPMSPGIERMHSYEHDEHQASLPLGAIPENGEPSPPALVDDDKDDASLATLAMDEDPDLWQDMDPIKLVENPVLFEEVYNNHTWWSVVRTHHRELLAELLATFVQLTIGFCGDMQMTLNNAGNPNTTAWVWGLATMIGIYISGGISGAHLNPAITTMLWFFRGFPKRKMPEYFIGQFLGAFLACYAAYGVYYSGIQDYLNAGTGTATDILNGIVTSQRFGFISAATAFFNEFVGTAFLACTVLALGDDQNAPPGAGMNSLIIGLVITGLNLSFVYNTGLAMNFARDFAPRLAMLSLGYGSALFTNPYWFYGPCVATILGAFVGATLYDTAIFEGGESPINYPLTRTKRSWKKGKAKWKRRMHFQKKEKKDDERWVN
ncbi:Putative major intrinsic protein [Septoria linicola]|uniref:Major intrinsic protein n=1 Tax=Septoria linicola TaxID=215465 RepID=A0A9Q9AUG1_9PEZI|nr:Putative major intrinsic protein [Septoria linicola]